MSETPGDAPRVDRMIHSLCLPLYVRQPCAGHPEQVYLRRITDLLARSSSWKPGPAPQGPTPDRWDAYRDYQTRAYFHPFVRRFLFDSRAVTRFHRTDVGFVRAGLDHWKTSDFDVELDVLRCELFVFQPDIVILRLELSPKTPMPMDRVLVMMDRLRRIYPPYVDRFQAKAESGAPPPPFTWIGGHCAQWVQLLDTAGQPFGPCEPMSETLAEPEASPASLDAHVQRMLSRGVDPAAVHLPFAHWRSLLQPLALAGDVGTRCGLQLHLLADDRATTLSWLAVDQPKHISQGDWMRLCFCDDAGESHMQPYAREFSQRFAEQHFYDRYWFDGEVVVPGAGLQGTVQTTRRVVDNDLSPSRILNCGYAFAYVGSSKDTHFFTDEQRGAPAIFRHVYSDMAMVALFQKSALLSASLKLTEMVDRSPDGGRIQLPPPAKVREFYEQFVEFTQRFWFDEISPQEQGRELFAMWHRNLGTKRLYDEVRQELLDLVQYTELRASTRLNRLVARFGVLSLLIGVVGAVAAVYALDGVARYQDKLPLPVPANWVPVGLLLAALGLGVLSLVFAVRQRRRHPDDPA